MSMLSDKPKFLIIQTAFIGDVVLATPIASALKEIFPNATVDYLVKKGHEALLENNPNIHNIWSFDKSNKRQSLLRNIKIIRTEKYDVVVNVHRFFSSGLMTMLSGAKTKIGFQKNPLSAFYTHRIEHRIKHGIHEVDRNLKLLSVFGIQKKYRPLIIPSLKDQETIKPYTTEPYFCIAPASVWETKQLPKSKWIELLNKLEGKVYLIGGPKDHPLCEEIRVQTANKNVVNLAGELELMESVALMKSAQRNFVNDSGPMHFASAVNAPLTVFYCSTTPEFGFGPLSDDSIIAEVSGLSCRPCGLHGKKTCPEGNFKCGREMVV